MTYVLTLEVMLAKSKHIEFHICKHFNCSVLELTLPYDALMAPLFKAFSIYGRRSLSVKVHCVSY